MRKIHLLVLTCSMLVVAGMNVGVITIQAEEYSAEMTAGQNSAEEDRIRQRKNRKKRSRRYR